MFGLKLYQRKYVERLESELAYYQNLFSQERERGDRLTDQLLVNNGALPATETVRSEMREIRKSQAPSLDEQQKYLQEIASDMLSTSETEEEYDAMFSEPEDEPETAKEGA